MSFTRIRIDVRINSDKAMIDLGISIHYNRIIPHSLIKMSE